MIYVTITYSKCVQYSHATVNLILMAVEQKNMEHWKEPTIFVWVAASLSRPPISSLVPV